MGARGRPITAATTGAALHTLLDGERPTWVSRETWHALRTALEGLRADALAAIAERTVRERGPAIGAAVSVVQRWTAPGGWLGADEP